jgi:hypothetical protein
MTNQSTYIVMTASAKMPTTCWGRYGRVAVVRLEDGFEGTPKMISERARGVEEVVALWDRQHIGSTTRCAFSRALAEAEAMCEELNS